ncbi:hypothetical protein DPMN_011580 [Dreissena polymorpha]|uniref:Uncharacterized protein n=1 Tax=Dreissena polymorpha TaxID=45954 RepID=A0A9D4S217_DREPO|nr:hypothetical protein DPMN_011580 [Dreissena polymorpha]
MYAEICIEMEVGCMSTPESQKLDLKELTTVDMATAHPHIDADCTVYNVGHVFKKGLPTVVTRMGRKKGFSATEAFKWYPDMKTGEQINKHFVYETDGFFTFHKENAYEENDIIDAFYLKNLSSEKVDDTFKKIDDSVLKRFVFTVNVSENVF